MNCLICKGHYKAYEFQLHCITLPLFGYPRKYGQFPTSGFFGIEPPYKIHS
jgi:hypothetical protein